MIAVLFAVVVGLGSYAAYWYLTSEPSDGLDSNPTACTADAKICPNGSAVGRTLPNCEFASCPDGDAEIQASCQNHPGPNFCPGGIGDVIADGVDKNRCVIWVCKSAINCAEEGEIYSKVFTDEYPENCCSGLTEWASGMDTRKVENGECVATGMEAGSPVGTCLNCGNGICEKIENICNCSEDCD